MRLTIHNRIDRYTREEFMFYVYVEFADCGILVDSYELYQRSDVKCKYEMVAAYYRAKNKSSTIYERDIVVPKAVEYKLFAMLLKKMQLKKWSDRKGKGKGKSL